MLVSSLRNFEQRLESVEMFCWERVLTPDNAGSQSNLTSLRKYNFLEERKRLSAQRKERYFCSEERKHISLHLLMCIVLHCIALYTLPKTWCYLFSRLSVLGNPPQIQPPFLLSAQNLIHTHSRFGEENGKH